MKTPDSIPIKEENETKEEFIEIEVPFHVFQFLSSENADIEQLCRICFSTENDVMIPLFCTKENKILADMLMSFTAIHMSLDDGLPTQVCNTCKTQIEFCYDFKIKCENTDSTLKSLLKGEFITKDELYQNQNSNTTGDAIKDCVSTQPTNPEIKIKEEIEDLQFFEHHIIDDASDNDNLCIVQKEEKKNKERLVDSTKDCNKLHKVDSKKKRIGRKKKSHSCSHCSKQFPNLSSLKLHTNRFHVFERKAYPCLHCKKSYDSAYDLKLHSAIHTGGSTWKCNKCQKEFNSRAMLRRHVQRHMETKPYGCEMCGKTFAEAYALRRHLRVHTGEKIEKKYECHICNKKYSERRVLEFHLSRHTGVRPHACLTCGKTFPSPRLLASHTLVHTDRKPYACKYCDKRYTTLYMPSYF